MSDMQPPVNPLNGNALPPVEAQVEDPIVDLEENHETPTNYTVSDHGFAQALVSILS